MIFQRDFGISKVAQKAREYEKDKVEKSKFRPCIVPPSPLNIVDRKARRGLFLV